MPWQLPDRADVVLGLEQVSANERGKAWQVAGSETLRWRADSLTAPGRTILEDNLTEVVGFAWWARRVSNPRPPPCKGGARTAELLARLSISPARCQRCGC